MAKQTGLGDALFVDGVNLSGDIGSVQRVAGGPAALEVTGIDKSASERLGGLRDGGIDFTAWFNPDGAHVDLSSLPRTDRAVTYCRGLGVGSQAASTLAKQIDYAPTRAADGALSIVVQAAANAYGVEWGTQYTDGIRTDTAGTNGTSVDAGASSAFGLQAWLHVLSITGTSVTVKLQQSSDNGGADAFADVTGGAFAAASAPGAQRIATAGDLAVERYLRVVTTGTFSNAEFLVIVTRNDATPEF